MARDESGCEANDFNNDPRELDSVAESSPLVVNPHSTPGEEFVSYDVPPPGGPPLATEQFYATGPYENYEQQQTQPMLQFDIEEPSEDASRFPWGWWGRFRRFGKNTVVAPVRHLIDPIAHWSRRSNAFFDSCCSRFINPLLARRLIFLAVASVLIVTIHFWRRDASGNDSIHHDLNLLRSYIREYSRDLEGLLTTSAYFGSMSHLAGSSGGHTTAQYVHDTMESLGLVASISRFDVLLSHPDNSGIQVFADMDASNPLWSSDLLEGIALGENITETQTQPRPQMAMALPGDVRAPIVYINKGSKADIAQARDHGGIDGKIVVIEYGCEPIINAVERAALAGAKGVLVYANDTVNYPDKEAVVRGTLAFPQWYPGDPLSPGWPSSMALTVKFEEAQLVRIPVAPMSLKDAETLLDLVGDDQSKTVRLFVNPVIEERHQIANVFGRIPGIEQDSRSIIIGTKLDSFCYGASELAGLSALLDVARMLAYLRYEHGWQPLRTIYLVAWDGTDQNFAGATEWVEGVADSLSTQGLVYIDVGGIAERTSAEFTVRGNPLLDIDELLKEVAYGDNGLTLWDNLNHDKAYKPISDYGNWLAFDVHTGVPSIEVGFKGPAPRKTCYDSYQWAVDVGDPDMAQHRALAELTAYMALHFSSAPLLPYNIGRLGDSIHHYLEDLFNASAHAFEGDYGSFKTKLDSAFDMTQKGADGLMEIGVMYDQWQQQWEMLNSTVTAEEGVFREAPVIARARLNWNEQVSQMTKMIMDRNGIHNRNWYKNHLFGPQYIPPCDGLYGGTFPAARDAIELHQLGDFATTVLDAAAHIDAAASYILDMM